MTETCQCYGCETDSEAESDHCHRHQLLDRIDTEGAA